VDIKRGQDRPRPLPGSPTHELGELGVLVPEFLRDLHLKGEVLEVGLVLLLGGLLLLRHSLVLRGLLVRVDHVPGDAGELLVLTVKLLPRTRLLGSS
jgi:hypothetical protein